MSNTNYTELDVSDFGMRELHMLKDLLAALRYSNETDRNYTDKRKDYIVGSSCYQNCITDVYSEKIDIGCFTHCSWLMRK